MTLQPGPLIRRCFRHPKHSVLMLTFLAFVLLFVMTPFTVTLPRSDVTLNLSQPRHTNNEALNRTPATPTVDLHSRLGKQHNTPKTNQLLSVSWQGKVRPTLKFEVPVDARNIETVKFRTEMNKMDAKAGFIQENIEEDFKNNKQAEFVHAADVQKSGQALKSSTRQKKVGLQISKLPSGKNVSHKDKEHYHNNDGHGGQSLTNVNNAEASTDCGDLPFHTNDDQLKLFKPAIGGPDLCLLLDTLSTLTQTLTDANITFFLYSGSLLGSWRHHGLIPWDDDVDIAVEFRSQIYLRYLLTKLSPDYICVEHPPSGWKFYSSSAARIRHVGWAWPFVDICFFHQNGTHVTEHALKLFPEYVFPKQWIFPLNLRPFQGFSLPCPADTPRVLHKTYDVEQCVVGSYDHKEEKARGEGDLASVSCQRLYPLYPFVKRQAVSGRHLCLESVSLNGTVLSDMIVESSSC